MIETQIFSTRVMLKAILDKKEEKSKDKRVQFKSFQYNFSVLLIIK